MEYDILEDIQSGLPEAATRLPGSFVRASMNPMRKGIKDILLIAFKALLEVSLSAKFEPTY